MNDHVKFAVATVVSAAAFILLPACAKTKEVTHNTTAFVTGGSSEVFNATPAEVEVAVKAAAQDLKLVKTAEASVTDEGKTTRTFTFRSTDEDKKIVIAITGITDKSTRVNVSNGAFGDVDNRQTVLNKIRQHVAPEGTPTGV